MRFTWAADPRIAPDGSRVAFVKVAVDAEKDDYLTSIWLVPVPARGQGVEPRRLTNGPHDTAPRWSPDGTRLIFARTTEKDGKPQPPQLYLLSFAGGEPRPLTDLPKGASSPAWSPDGKTVAFLSGTTPEDLDKARRVKKGEKPERESDVRIVTRDEFRRDNAGYRDVLHPSHLWTIPVPGPGDSPADALPEPRRLTSGPFEEAEPTWSRDGRQLYFLSDRDLEPYHRPDRSAVYVIPAEGGPIRKVAGIPGSVQDLAVSPDGKRLAFRGTLGEPARSFAQPDLYVVDATPGAVPRNVTASFDGDIGSGLAGDQHPPRGAARAVPVWSRDQTAIVDVAAERGRANLVSIDVASGKVTSLTRADQEVIAFTASADGSRLAVLAATATEPGDLFLVQPGSGPPRAADLTERQALCRARHHSTRGDRVRQLRRAEDPRLDPEAGGIPGRHPVSADPEYPRRPARRLWPHVLPRVPPDGRPRVCRLVPEPTGEQQLRGRVRQHHPVPLSRRRLQGPDGRRGRARAARDCRPEAAGRDGRQRRRAAHELDDHADRPIRRGGIPALDCRLVRVVVHGRLHALSAPLVPVAAVPRPRGIRGPFAADLRREGQDAAHADRG